MKTPRDILFARHQSAAPKLDAIRREVVAGLNHQDTKAQSWSAILVSWCLGGSNKLWLELIWPSRRIWSGLAAVWVLIFVVNFSLRDSSQMTIAKSSPPEMMMSFRAQQKLMNELLTDRSLPMDVEPPKNFLAKTTDGSLENFNDMNETPETHVEKPSLATRFFRWLFSWRTARRALIGLIAFATLIALLITEENWRGKRAWQDYQREWEAKGEKFDWQAFVPPSVPDNQNFFAAPIFTNLLKGGFKMSVLRADGTYVTNARPGYWVTAVATDLKARQTYYRNPPKTNMANEFPVAPQPQTPAADVLLALSKYNPAIEELRQASQRPDACIPLNYDGGFDAVTPLLHYLSALKRCSQVLQLRAVAELADGQSAKALDDVKLLFRLNDSLRNSPFLISHLVRFAIVDIALQPVWEGLAEHKWSDEQLAALDAELAKQDFLADYGFAMRGERAFAIASFENERRTREMIVPQADGDSAGNKPLVVSLRLVPSAYFYQNELAFAQMHQQWTLPLVDAQTRIVSPDAVHRADNAVREEKKSYSPYKVQAVMLFPVVSHSVEKFAFAQSSIDLARAASALERFRIAHGNYPDTLGALAPQFIAQLPHDLINGQPLHYRRTDDGRFVLYSVGWNGTDDGGQIALTKGGAVDKDKGDWVWQYPVP